MILSNLYKNKHDEYYTPNYAIIPLLKYIPNDATIWCPFDTIDSNFVKIFTKHGNKVINTHLLTGHDFFTYEPEEHYDYIISNPPYSMKSEIFHRLFSLKKKFAMLVGIVGVFESEERFNLFKTNDFEIMYFNKRISYFTDYQNQKTNINPPFSSAYVAQGIFPKQIIFEEVRKTPNLLDILF